MSARVGQGTAGGPIGSACPDKRRDAGVGRCGRGGTVDARGLGPRPFGGGGSTPLARTGVVGVTRLHGSTPGHQPDAIDEMITGRDVTIEIGGRTLLRDASFMVGPDDKVGLVGRNGTGKSSLVSVICGQVTPAPARGGRRRLSKAPSASCPRCRRPGGLGLEPTGFSHVLSARGLDVLDEEMHKARRAVAADPTTEAIATFAETRGALRSSRRIQPRGRDRPSGRGDRACARTPCSTTSIRCRVDSAGASTSSGSCSGGPTRSCSTSPPTI